MRSQLTLAPAGDFIEVLPQIFARAREDQRIIHRRAPGNEHWLVFCDNAELAKHEAAQLAVGGNVSPSLGVVEISPDFGVISLNQECGEDARLVMVEFVKWILTAFAPCKVFDEYTHEDLSELANNNPCALFDEE